MRKNDQTRGESENERRDDPLSQRHESVRFVPLVAGNAPSAFDVLRIIFLCGLDMILSIFLASYPCCSKDKDGDSFRFNAGDR